MITQTLTTAFKLGLLQGIHNFGPTLPSTFKIALYSSTANLNADTLGYTTSGEITGNAYAAGGATLSISTQPASSNGVAYVSFNNVSWVGASFTVGGALIYNSTAPTANNSVAVLNFGGNKVISNGTFTIQFPPAAYTSAIIRIA